MKTEQKHQIYAANDIRLWKYTRCIRHLGGPIGRWDQIIDGKLLHSPFCAYAV